MDRQYEPCFVLNRATALPVIVDTVTNGGTVPAGGGAGAVSTAPAASGAPTAAPAAHGAKGEEYDVVHVTYTWAGTGDARQFVAVFGDARGFVLSSAVLTRGKVRGRTYARRLACGS